MERVPENKNSNTAKPASGKNTQSSAPSPKPSLPNRASAAGAGPRVAVKRPSASGRSSASVPSDKQAAGKGRVYPINNPAASQNKQVPPSSGQKNSVHSNRTHAKQPAVSESKNKQPTQPIKKNKLPKEPRGPWITAEGVGQFLFVVLVSLVIYAVLCGIAYGVFYGINHFRWSWNYDITVKLEDSSKKPPSYTASKNTVFRGEDNEPYIAVSRLAGSLGLSAVGDAESIRFYKTGDMTGYAVFTDHSKEVSVNGVIIRLSSPVYIVNGIAYVPISFFNYYTSGITISYDQDERVMTVLYTVDEALSTPKRKILQEFAFCVNSPEALDELTEKEWFEYVGNQS